MATHVLINLNDITTSILVTQILKTYHALYKNPDKTVQVSNTVPGVNDTHRFSPQIYILISLCALSSLQSGCPVL